MLKARQVDSISRTLLLPSEHQEGTIRLRYQLAEDGCKESQVALAKCLLTKPIKTLEERNFNAQLAVYWLLQAANKGQEEAVALLKDCSNAGIGINTRNSCEIEKCLNFSEIEIISRKVAFSLFQAIMSDTEDILSEESFREKIDKLLLDDSDEPTSTVDESSLLPGKLTASKQSNESKLSFNEPNISFSEVVNSVQTCLEGNVPIVSLKQVSDYGEPKKWPIVKYLYGFWNLIVNAMEDLVHCFSSLTILVSVLLMCICICFASSLTTPGTEVNQFICNTNLFFVTFLCLLTLLSSTCFIVCISFDVENLQKWLHLIKVFEPNIKPKEVERKYLMKTAYPLLSFFIISALYITLLPLISIQDISMELGLLALTLMLFVDRSISQQRYHINISLFLNALTCLYKSKILQKMSVSSLSFLNFDIIYEIGKNYQIHLSLISCLALPFVLPYLYVKMALGSEKSWHLVLLPHLMSLTWMNLACFHLARVDTTNLLFTLCICLFLLIVSRYFGVALTLLLYVILKAIIVTGYVNFHLMLFIPTFVLFYFVSSFCVKKFKLSNESKLCSVVICMLVLILSYQAVQPSSFSDQNSIVPWDKYESYCHHRSWYRTNPAEVQITCLPFKGKKISVEGSVSSIEVVEVENSFQTVANILPSFLSDWFCYIFGSRCDAENADKAQCQIYQTLNINDCHLNNWNKYKYEITLEVSSRSSPEIILHANNICSDFIRNLKEGDVLRTSSVFESNMGGSLPKLQLVKAECSSCSSNINCNTSVKVPQLNYSDSIRNFVWFYLSPFIQYPLKK